MLLFLSWLDAEAVFHQDIPDAPIVRAERHRLRSWLATNLKIQWGKRVSRVQEDDEGVVVFFEDGTSAKGDFLVGADGIKSVGKLHHSNRIPPMHNLCSQNLI